jgi:hypothetical protein
MHVHDGHPGAIVAEVDEPAKKKRLHALADGLGALRDIAVAVVAKRLGDL